MKSLYLWRYTTKGLPYKDYLLIPYKGKTEKVRLLKEYKAKGWQLVEF